MYIQEDVKKHIYLSSIEFFKEYLKENFVHQKTIQLKQGDKLLDISIFPNAKLYEMNGESLTDVDEVWRIMYGLVKEGKLKILNKI